MARSAAPDSASESRESILRAALEAFAKKGFDAATTRDIATAAGVNHGLIPYYFGGKLKLWQAAVDRAFADLNAGISGVFEGGEAADDRERAGLIIRNYVRFVAKHPEFVFLMHEEGKRRGPRMRWLVDRHVKPMYTAVATMVERGQKSGVIPKEIAPVHFHYMLAGAVGVIFHQAEECKRLTGVDPFDEATVEAHARAVEQMLLGPAKREESK